MMNEFSNQQYIFRNNILSNNKHRKMKKINLKKSEKFTGIILAVLLLFVTLSSTFFFLGKLKVSILDWVAFNACAPISYLYLCLFLIFLIRKNPALLVFTFLPTFVFGTMAMFVLPWNEANLIPHIGHIIMTLNLMWVLYIVFKYKDYKHSAICFLISIIVFTPYIGYALSYNQAHAEDLVRLIQQQQ